MAPAYAILSRLRCAPVRAAPRRDFPDVGGEVESGAPRKAAGVAAGFLPGPHRFRCATARAAPRRDFPDAVGIESFTTWSGKSKPRPLARYFLRELCPRFAGVAIPPQQGNLLSCTAFAAVSSRAPRCPGAGHRALLHTFATLLRGVQIGPIDYTIVYSIGQAPTPRAPRGAGGAGGV